MVRWILGLSTLAVLGCEEDEPLVPVFDIPEPTLGTDSGAEPLPPLRETRLRMGAIFRYDAATGLPGPWLDESNGNSTSAIQIIVGDDQYDGVNGQWCEVLVPISGLGASPLGDLAPDQFWGTRLVVNPDNIQTNCDEPEYERLWNFYSGVMVDYLTTNIDGSDPDWGVVVGVPSDAAVSWAQGSALAEEDIIGGEIRLSDRFGGRMSAIVALGVETDTDGVVRTDATGASIPIALANVPLGDGIREGVYRFIAYQYQVVSQSQP